MNVTFDTKVENLVSTKVYEILDYTSLKIFKDKLKANTVSIQSDLGGEANGNLGLTMTATEYDFVSHILYY